MIDLKQYEVWFVTGSQHLYGPKTLETVAEHSREIAAFLDASAHIPVKVIFKPVLTTPDAIDHLDAYVFTCQNVDRGFESSEETISTFAHPI